MDALTLVHNINRVIINPLILVLFSVALLVFLYGVYEYVVGADNPEERTKGGKHILYGLIGLFIMMSAFGIIDIILGTFGVSTANVNQVESR